MRFLPRIVITLFILGISIPSFVHAQVVGVSFPKRDIVSEEQTTATVYVSSPYQAMNAVSGTLTFPASLKLVSINHTGSIVDFWTQEPAAVGGTIHFEGITLNPGFQGERGILFTITFLGKKTGTAFVAMNDASVLANDGLGSNIVTRLGSAQLNIIGGAVPSQEESSQSPVKPTSVSVKALPVITDYSAAITAKDFAYVRGRGEPGAITKITFKNTSLRSIGEQFIAALQAKRRSLDEVLVKNDPKDGTFEFRSGNGLVAGAYNATPFLVDEDTNTERPGLGVQLFVSDSKLVRGLIVLINVLALLIPVVGLAVLIYFIPWYSFRRMRLLRRRLGLEEDKLVLSSHDIGREDRKHEQASVESPPHSENAPPVV